MATLTIRNLPQALVRRLKRVAAANGRSMEQEVRELLRERYMSRRQLLRRIRDGWSELPETSAAEVDAWIETGRE